MSRRPVLPVSDRGDEGGWNYPIRKIKRTKNGVVCKMVRFDFVCKYDSAVV